jgi:replicative DNA helicase
VFELKLRSGRTVKASGNHPFLTIDGWLRLDELNVGDRIAAPRRVPEPAVPKPMAESEVVLLAHLLGDGCMVARQPLHYTSADEENIQAVEHAAVHFGVTARAVRQKTWTHVYLPAPYKLTHGRRNPIAAWLDGLGVFGLHSWEKFVPKPVFRLPNDQLALFIRHIWSTDGSVAVGDRRRIYYASTCRQMVDDLQQLLLRFEIQTHIYTAKKFGYRNSYHLTITAAENEDRFLDLIGVHGARGVQAAALVAGRSKHKYTDSVPASVWDQIRSSLASQGRTMHRLQKDIGARSQIARAAPSRDSLRRIGLALANEKLLRLANSDVSWDEIVSIMSLGDQPVFDATVRETHNFVANGIVSENSLEQDADVVMFLYRDEVYNAESADRGTAEIIVAKHRNGPTGTARLAFLDHYARFANMARSV